MDDWTRQYLPIIYIAFIWLTVSGILGLLSGWYFLMNKYPDREDEVLLQAKYQSGSMGLLSGWYFLGLGVEMRGILKIGVCRSGLRIGIVRIFGIFCRDFFVPWRELRVQRKDYFFFKIAELKFGNSAIGRLKISAELADRLARSAIGYWPEPMFPEETDKQLLARLTKRWLLMTSVAAAFFIIMPKLLDTHFPPIAIAILFPATVFGVLSLFEYLEHAKR
jgi:hypothetical protein